MTLEEIARRIVIENAQEHLNRPELIEAIMAALQDARRQALEEAARIHIPPPGVAPSFILCRDDYNSGHQGGQAELRQAIRALISQEDAHG